MSYPFAQIEPFWRDYWEKNRTFHAPNPHEPGFIANQPKFYVLDMFPYPSGRGLHVGHPLGYIASDIMARFKRMQGFNVLHPMGFDAFGLPAEQYAIETNTHPQVTTSANIENMRSQLKLCALSFDWDREFATTDPDYYKWTQWIFLKLFGSWFNPSSRKAEPIENLIQRYESDEFRVLNQTRILKTDDVWNQSKKWTALSTKEKELVLLEDRIAYMKEVSVNWCPGLGTVLANEEVTVDGKSERGNFPVYQRPLKQWMLRITSYADRLVDDLKSVDWPEAIKLMQTHWIGKSEGASIHFQVENHTDETIEVFTTRPDTLFGATFVVLAAEHPLTEKISTKEAFTKILEIRESNKLATPEVEQEKLGVFTGAYATHPIHGNKIPIWVANYVLIGYGTGAIMAVPAHDERDFDFAKLQNLPMIAVVKPTETFLAEHSVDLETYLKNPGALKKAFAGWETSINSHHDTFSMNDISSVDAKKKITDHLSQKKVGRGRVQYKLKDWLFSRQRYWGEPFPILHHPDGYPVAVSEKDLPVTLPPIKDFRPQSSDNPNSEPAPLLSRASSTWVHVKKDGTEYTRELNTMPNWAGSCWYYLRFADPKNPESFVGQEAEKYWMGKNGVDLYIGGVEHAVLHLLYARFWHKVLFDLGYVSTNEPFGKLFNQGYIQAYSYQDERGMYADASKVKEKSPGKFEVDGNLVTRHLGKMGKSLKNSISPDEVIQMYGCDTFRLYEMYLGPVEQSKTWDTEAIIGVHRFLQRVWRNLVSDDGKNMLVDPKNSEGKLESKLHETIFDVTRFMSDMRYNTAIAKLIELNNSLVELEKVPVDVAKSLILMLAPIAPHICEELWKRMGEKETIAFASWPSYDETLLQENEIEIIVQVNGKKRGGVVVPIDADQATVVAKAKEDSSIARHLGTSIIKVIFVPKRLLNFVVKI